MHDHIKTAARNYAKIILEYPNGPFYEESQDLLFNSKLLMAEYYAKNNQCRQAIGLYSKLVSSLSDSNDNSYAAYLHMGDCYFEMKNFALSLKAYDKAASLNEIPQKHQSRINELRNIVESKIDYEEKITELKLSREKKIGLNSEFIPTKQKNRDEIIFEKAKSFFSQEKYSSVFKNIDRLLTEFPGTSYSSDANKLFIDSVKVLIAKGKKRIPWGSHYNTRVISDISLSYIQKSDLKNRIKASSLLYRQEFLKDSALILETIVKDFPQSDFVPRACLILSRIYRVEGKLEKALFYLSMIQQKYPGSQLNNFSLFKSGLIYFENKNYPAALKYFKQYLVLEDSSKDQALFWIGHTYEKLKDIDNRTKYYEELKKTDPLSFYASIEGAYSHILSLNSKDQNLPQYSEIKKFLSIKEDIHLNRAISFLYIGFFDYADYELQKIDGDGKTLLNAYLAGLLYNSGLFRKAITKAYIATKSYPEMIDSNILSIFFPFNYLHELIKQENLYGIDNLLLLSLIKQESAFDESAVSRSGALGLMQIMPATADDVSSRLKLSRNVPKDNLIDSKINIRLATYYFYKVINNLKGNSIFALASYNAGPSKVKEWINQSKDLSLIEFIEQIPTAETNNYVKSIARNYIFYSHLMDKKLKTLNDLQNIKYNPSLLVPQK